MTASETRNKRDALADAARIAAEAFAAQPWREINMNEIARAAKCSLTTIYNAFGGKEPFILYAISHAMTLELPDLGASERDHLRPDALLWLNLYAHARFLTADATRQSFANLASLPSDALEARRVYHEKIMRFRVHLAGLVSRGQADGAIRADDPLAAATNLIARSGWQLGLWPLVLGDLATTPALEQLTDEALAPYLTADGAAHMEQWRASRP